MSGEEMELIFEGVLEPRSRALPAVVGVLLVILSIGSRSATSILTPIWLDSLNNNTNGNITDKCDEHYKDASEHQIDAYSIMVIVNSLITVFLGFILLVTRILCPYLITDRERSYDKREFALVGISDTVSGIFFVYASSGCRTAPYLQSLAANFCVPVTFIMRYLILQKRPTCRKTACAILVLFAEVTALIPDIVPGLESQQARQDQGGASGVAGVLWPMCFFVGYVPLALLSVVLEKVMKTSSKVRNKDTNLNMVYLLFWCYFYNVLAHLLLFWTDIIPGFGMADNITDFAKGFWFNVKCYFGYVTECHGPMVWVWSMCTVLLFVNRLVNSYFLRFLEGANYLVIITTVQTPLVFLFFTLFDENPVRWHPHAYLSTWLSIAALCIMIPAIYIYDTGAPEVVPDKPNTDGAVTVTTVVTATHRGSQTDGYPGSQTDDTVPLLYNNDSADETTPMVYHRTRSGGSLTYNTNIETNTVNNDS